MGIPANVSAALAVHGSAVAAGVITMTWRADSTDLAAVTYSLTPDGVSPPVQWTEGGTCLTSGFC